MRVQRDLDAFSCCDTGYNKPQVLQIRLHAPRGKLVTHGVKLGTAAHQVEEQFLICLKTSHEHWLKPLSGPLKARDIELQHRKFGVKHVQHHVRYETDFQAAAPTELHHQVVYKYAATTQVCSNPRVICRIHSSQAPEHALLLLLTHAAT